MLCEEIVAVRSEKCTKYKYILHVCSAGKDKSSTLLHFIVGLHAVITGLWAVKFDKNY